MKTRERERTLSTTDIVIVFARQGVAIETMARALALPVEQIENVCRKAREKGDLVMLPPLVAKDARGSLQAEIVHLRDALDREKALTAELRRASDAEHFGFYGVAGMTDKESIIVAALAKHGVASKARIYDALYGLCLEQDRPEPKIIDVFVCKVRHKLRPHGIEIKTVWGRGYEMTAENIAKLNRLVRRLPYVESPSLAPAAA